MQCCGWYQQRSWPWYVGTRYFSHLALNPRLTAGGSNRIAQRCGKKNRWSWNLYKSTGEIYVKILNIYKFLLYDMIMSPWFLNAFLPNTNGQMDIAVPRLLQENRSPTLQFPLVSPTNGRNFWTTYRVWVKWSKWHRFGFLVIFWQSFTGTLGIFRQHNNHKGRGFTWWILMMYLRPIRLTTEMVKICGFRALKTTYLSGSLWYDLQELKHVFLNCESDMKGSFGDHLLHQKQ